jgi:hypothetical protein
MEFAWVTWKDGEQRATSRTTADLSTAQITKGVICSAQDDTSWIGKKTRLGGGTVVRCRVQERRMGLVVSESMTGNKEQPQEQPQIFRLRRSQKA